MIPHAGMPPTGPNSPYDDMSGAPVPDGSAVQDANDPYAKSYFNPYAQYVGWAQEEQPDSRVIGAQRHGLGLDTHEPYFYKRVNDKVRLIDDKQEIVAWADEGPLSRNPTPLSRGTQPTEPNNNTPDDPRIVRAGVCYTFFRNWTDPQRNEQGFNGAHVSLADVVVVQPVGGMHPVYVKNKRNTYRISPEPWDLNLVDLSYNPHDNASAPTAAKIPPNVGGQSYRLG